MTATLSPYVCALVSRYARLSPWMDRVDLEQEASLTELEVRLAGRWLEARDPVEYMAGAVRSRLWRMVMRARCQVHVGVGARTGGWSAAYDAMASVRLCEVDDNDSVSTPSQEDDLDRARALAELRRVLAEQSEAARAVILDEQKPAEVAKALGLTAKQVYWQTERARDAVRARLEDMVRE